MLVRSPPKGKRGTSTTCLGKKIFKGILIRDGNRRKTRKKAPFVVNFNAARPHVRKGNFLFGREEGKAF